MTVPSRASSALTTYKRSKLALCAVLAIQAICALFFVTDVIYDLLGIGEFLGAATHLYAELAVVVSLLLGIVFVSFEIQKVLLIQRRLENQLKVTSGAFHQLLEQYFNEWNLTPSERDVALFSIKGLSIAEIAGVRQTREGTVKAQSNSIYRKSGVSGRSQLLSLFVEQLIADDLIGSQATQV